MSDPLHPYKSQPDRAFWARAVTRSFETGTLLKTAEPLIRRGEKVVSAGSCFASTLAPYFERAGLRYVRMEQMHPAFASALQDLHVKASHPPSPRAALRRIFWPKRGAAPLVLDNFGYAEFSAAYGNLYTVRQLLQLLRRATGAFQPVESHWIVGDEVVDPFRPGLRYRARSLVEFEALTRQHLARTKAAFLAADVFVLTLGLTEAWISTRDGAVFPACPGTIAGAYDATRHRLVNFTVSEISADLASFVEELRVLNPACRFILTVSPVQIIATATDNHVLAASTYTKSALRAAAQEAADRLPGVTYFPAYEITIGPQAPKTYFEPNRREVSKDAVEVVMASLLSHCDVLKDTSLTSPRSGPSRALSSPETAAALSAALVDAECEEVMSER